MNRESMDLSNIIDERVCTVALSSGNKEDCMRELADLACSGLDGVTSDEVHRALLEREDVGSTGFERGVAIPHARLPQVQHFVFGVALSKHGIEYDSIDGKRTRLFFLLVGPDEDPQAYLKFLAKISRIGINQLLQKDLLAALTRRQLADTVVAHLQPMEVPSLGNSSSVGDRLLFVVIYELDYFDDIVTLFLERGIRGVSVLETKGVRGMLTGIPIFGDFLNFLGEKNDMSRTMMAVVPAGEFDRLVAEIEEITGDLDTRSGAALIAVDLLFSKGLLRKS